MFSHFLPLFQVSRQNVQRWKKEVDAIQRVMKSRSFRSSKVRKIRKGKAKYPLIDESVLKYVKEKRKKGVSVSGKMIRKKAIKLLPTLYPDDNTFKASSGFLRNFLRRNGLSQRTVTGVGQKIPEDAPELCEAFLEDLASISDEYDVIINMDETPLYFDLPSNKTIDFKGVKTVTLKTTGNEKLRYTVLLTAGVQKVGGIYRGFRLPPLVIFKNLKRPPKGKFPPGMVVLGTKGGSTTQDIMMSSYIPKVLSRRPGGYFNALSTLLIMDSATSHVTPPVLDSLKDKKIDYKIINGGLTPLIQFLDTHVNKTYKGGMREKWEDWMENAVAEYTKGGKRRRASYEVICQWVNEVWQQVSPESIVKGFEENGYIGYNMDTSVLHSTLQDTLRNRKVPANVIEEMDALIREFALIDETNEDRETKVVVETVEDQNIHLAKEESEVSSEHESEPDENGNMDNAELSTDGESELVDIMNSDTESEAVAENKSDENNSNMNDESDNSTDVEDDSDEDESSTDSETDDDSEGDEDMMGNISESEISTDNESYTAVMNNKKESSAICQDNDWIKNNKYNLKLNDKLILHSRKWLNDTIMDAAQFLICEALDTTFQSVLNCQKVFHPVDKEHVQLLHDGDNHWLLVFCSNDRVQVCDSMRDTLTPVTKRCIKTLFSFAIRPDGKLPVAMLSVRKQDDNFNCGPFAIAYAADLLAGIMPINSHYDVLHMRSHLTECLEKEMLEPFPKIEKRKRKVLRDAIEVIDI